MSIAESKITSQGQISVPAKVRHKLGLEPGSTIEWHESGDEIIVRRATKFSSEDIHKVLFPRSPKPRSLDELKESLRERARRKYERR